jgi:hypothetical protein
MTEQTVNKRATMSQKPNRVIKVLALTAVLLSPHTTKADSPAQTANS